MLLGILKKQLFDKTTKTQHLPKNHVNEVRNFAQAGDRGGVKLAELKGFVLKDSLSDEDQQ